MNPAMLMFLLPVVQKLFAGGKLDGLLSGMLGGDALKDLFGSNEASSYEQVLGALAILATHVPPDPDSATTYGNAVLKLLEGLSALRIVLAEKA